MFKFRFPHKPNAKTKLARRVFFVRKRTLAIPAGLAAVCALCLITTLPSYVSAASTQRQLPIYCVQREDKVCSLTFDAAWGQRGYPTAHRHFGTLPCQGHVLCGG